MEFFTITQWPAKQSPWKCSSIHDQQTNMISINDIKRTMKHHCKIHETQSSLAMAFSILHKLFIKKIKSLDHTMTSYGGHEYFLQLTHWTESETKIVTTVFYFTHLIIFPVLCWTWSHEFAGQEMPTPQNFYRLERQKINLT